MQIFKDRQGREWTVELTLGSVRRIKNLVGVDLLDIANEKIFEGLANDPEQLVNVVFAACKPQAEKNNVTDIDFGEAMAGDTIAAATGALLEELVNFIQAYKPRRGQLLRRALEKLEAVEEKAIQKAEALIGSDEFDKHIEKALGQSLTSLPGLSEPTRTD